MAPFSVACAFCKMAGKLLWEPLGQNSGLLQACNLSFAKFIGLGNRRRQLGISPVNTAPPPVFLAEAELDRQLPCRDSLNPVITTLNLDGCRVQEVRDGKGGTRLLQLCTDA